MYTHASHLYIALLLLLFFRVATGEVQAQTLQAPTYNNVKPLYSIADENHDYHYKNFFYAPHASYKGAVHWNGTGAHATTGRYNLVSAWKGQVNSIGSSAPSATIMPSVSIGGPRRAPGGGNVPGEPNTDPPVGDTPYWMFALLLLAYSVYIYRKRQETQSSKA